MKVLLVEDDAMLARAIEDGIVQQQWVVDRVSDAAAARTALVDHAYAVVLLDIGLPGSSGLDVLRAMRDRFDATPAILLTARGQLSERIAGLDAGADDYLVKPFELGELVARIRAVLRRAEGSVVGALSHGPVSLDPVRRRVQLDGCDIQVSGHEYHLLLALLKRRGHIVTRDELERAVYGDVGAVGSNTVSVFIHQLRKKLGEDAIATVHGQGYTIGRRP